MFYDQEKSNAMTLMEFGDKFLSDLESLVSSKPYIAFFILSAALEFIARCKDKLTDLHDRGDTKERYVAAIQKIDALKPYKKFNVGRGNKLYSALRCGLLHAALPNNGIILSSGGNELDKNVIGCRGLYNDIKTAWEELKADDEIEKYLKEKKSLVFSDKLPNN